MHFLSINNNNVRRTSNRYSFGYQSGYKTGYSGPVIYAGGNSRLLHSLQSDDESQHHEFPLTRSPSQVYYSFDYAQKVHFPSDPLQPYPIYFPSDPLQPDPIYSLTTRKCSVFGVCYEAIPRQIDFITQESGETGKRANAVISRLRCFYENHGLGEKDVIFMLTTVLAHYCPLLLPVLHCKLLTG